jgi:hypothetical protein
VDEGWGVKIRKRRQRDGQPFLQDDGQAIFQPSRYEKRRKKWPEVANRVNESELPFLFGHRDAAACSGCTRCEPRPIGLRLVSGISRVTNCSEATHWTKKWGTKSYYERARRSAKSLGSADLGCLILELIVARLFRINPDRLCLVADFPDLIDAISGGNRVSGGFVAEKCDGHTTNCAARREHLPVARG